MATDFETEADKIIAGCFSLNAPKSFFLFAGAGSGKTRSLVNALNHIETTIGDAFRLCGKRVAVITFTNAAADEITRRIQYNPLFSISTIHSFAWDLIKGFDKDIGDWLKQKLNCDILEDQAELERKSASRRAKQSTLDKLNASIDKKRSRLNELDAIRRFTYDPSPSALNSGKDSLSHSEVLGICAYFLAKKPLMAKILIQRFPVLLIDESQDTNKDLMEVFLLIQKTYSYSFSLGLFGDTKQRIYGGGKTDLATMKWSEMGFETPEKLINHRSGSRIIDFANKIGKRIDNTLKQRALSQNSDGIIHLFIAPTCSDKVIIEKMVKEEMVKISGDKLWEKDNWEGEEGASLILEHRMAARRLGFLEMWDAVKELKEFESIKEGTSTEINWFAKFILPLIQTENPFEIAKIAKEQNKTLFKRANKEVLDKVRLSVSNIRRAYLDNHDIAFEKIVNVARENEVFEIPRKFNENLDKFAPFLATKFSQIMPYSEYVTEKSGFRTHHGVKGLQFDCVMAIIDNESNWNSYNHSHFFLDGNVNEGTLRLLYVICTRAKKSLAIVLYADAAKESIAKDWFADNEITIFS